MKAFILALLLLAPVSALAAGTATDQVTFRPLTSTTCTTGRACIYSLSSDNLLYTVDANGLGLKLHSAQAFRTSSNCSGLASPANGDVCYDTTLSLFRYYSGGWFSGPGTTSETFFSRTCTITSAAAATPVTCLADADVPATAAVHLMGWHAKVNGATAWATTTACTLKDTSALTMPFFSVAATALTGNAFVVDDSSGVSQAPSYSLNQNAAIGRGLTFGCDANGTGSDVVLTIFGSIK